MCTILLGLFLLSQKGATLPTPTTLTVCELFNDLASYNGQVVAVRGEWSVGEEHNSLHNEGGKPCPQRFVTLGYVWADAINLMPSHHEHNSATFDVDEQDIKRQLSNAVRKEKIKKGEPVAIVVTFIGLLETRKQSDWVALADPRGEVQGLGFGHLGVCPAQLWYKTIRDVVIRKPESKGKKEKYRN